MIKPGSFSRLNVVAVLCVLPFVLVLGRAVWLQAIRGEANARRAESQHMIRVWQPPHRGTITDRNGVPLAYTMYANSPIGEQRKGLKRVYPQGYAAAHVLGFLDHRGHGRAGIEAELDELLRGHPGWSTELRDARGRSHVALGKQTKPPVHGYDVELTLDATLQDVAASELERTVKRLGARGGCLVAVDPRTGEILAMANWPSFDPERVKSARPEAMRNRVVSDPYEPGSTFKLVAAAASLTDGLLKPQTAIHCEEGRHNFGGYTITDHHPYGTLSLKRSFAVSSNIAFAKVGNLCNTRLYDLSRALGFGSPTGISLPGESGGRILPPKEWSGRSAATVAIGYEVLATPLQLVMAYAAVANDGVLMRPKLIRRIRDQQGKLVMEDRPERVRRAIEPGVAKTLRSFLGEVMVSGTGKGAALEWVTVGGKTGTTEKIVNGRYSKKHHYASFVGLAPLEDPRLVALVMIDEPRGTEAFGASAAAPVFRDMLDGAGRLPGAWLGQKYDVVVVPKEEDEGFAGMMVAPLVAKDAGAPLRNLSPDAGIPDVRGMPLRAALKTLRAYGITASVRGTGMVMRQSPSPGSAVRRRVTLECNRSGGGRVVLASESDAFREEGRRYRTSASGKR